MPKRLTSIADLTPDPYNANRGTRRGHALLERSLERTGAGRSIVVDREGRIIAGNKTWEEAGQLGFEIEVVKTDGTKLVVVQRTDLDLASAADARARELALADNRAGEVGLDWDGNVLLNHLPGVDVGGYFFDAELASLWDDSHAKGELAKPKEDAPPAAARTVEPDAEATSPHDPTDEDQTVCPECGHRF
jgi:hypothetical protein